MIAGCSSYICPHCGLPVEHLAFHEGRLDCIDAWVLVILRRTPGHPRPVWQIAADVPAHLQADFKEVQQAVMRRIERQAVRT
jgi:hypothetical protein